MVRVGIPRALLYYQYYPMWQTFFQELGAEVVVSPPTTNVTLARGSSRVVAETCLPARVFLGQVLALVKESDCIFIPVIRSVKEKAYSCAKFLGLPDMTRAVIPESPPVLEVEIDINRGKRELYLAIYRLGRHFTWSPSKVRRASIAAGQAHFHYRELMSRRGVTPPEAIARLSGEAEKEPHANPEPPAGTTYSIAVIGHPYLLYDEYPNHNLLHRLQQAHCRILTPEMLTTQQLETAVAGVVGRAYWAYEEDVVGAGAHYLQSGVDGVIGIMPFGCGPDSLMMDMVRRQAARMRDTPFMCLTLEEHTAEAGIVTRLEAFLDMIYRRKRRPVCV